MFDSIFGVPETSQEPPNPRRKYHFLSNPTSRICTDNIYRMLEYLPCKGSHGLAELLIQPSVEKLFETEYLGIKINLQKLAQKSKIKVQYEFFLITSDQNLHYRDDP